MRIFSRKQSVNLEEFCRDYYESKILNLSFNGVDISEVYPEVIRKNIVDADNNFSIIKTEQIASELIPLRFELFATAWMHRFVNKYAIEQSLFTKRFLYKINRIDVWKAMTEYAAYIDGGTLHWLEGLSGANTIFNYNLRQGLCDENTKRSQKIGLTEIDYDVINVTNFRVLSETAWKQNLLLGGISDLFCKKVGFLEALSSKAEINLELFIKGLYDGARQDLDRIKIKPNG